MSIGGDLWFGLFRNVDETLKSRLQSGRNLFDALLLETFGRGQSQYRSYREESGIEIPALSPAVDSHVAITGFLLATAEASESTDHLTRTLDDGLKKVSLKHPAAGMPAFANDWKLLLGGAVGIQRGLKLGSAGDWTSHRAYVLGCTDNLHVAGDFNSAIMVRFIRQVLGEPMGSTPTARRAEFMSAAELIFCAWAHHVQLSPAIPEEACWTALASRFETIRLKDLGFQELSLLLVVLKDQWTAGWVSRKVQGLEFVKNTLRDFLPCARRDLKAALIRNEGDVQRIVWAILRPAFPDLVDEEFLRKFGAKNYKPDFGIPSLRLLIEAKYVNASKTVGEIQDELQADVIGYRESSSEYTRILFFVYDTRGEVAAQTELRRVICAQPGVEDLIVVVGPGLGATPKARSKAPRRAASGVS